jgi:hypothetical protein
MLHRSALVLAAAGTLAAAGLISTASAAASDSAPAASDGGSTASASEATTRQLLEQVKQLLQKVQQLEARQEQQQRRSSADVAATVEQIYQDAARRSAMLEALPLSSNWQAGKFILRSEDGNFLLHPWLQMQLRGTANYRDDASGAGGSDFESGFELRRMKFGFDGNVFSPDVTYLFNWATNRNTGNPELEEAWVRAKVSDDWSVRGGQMKDPFARESLISSKKFLAADRTVLTDTFTGGDNYVQGVSAGYAREALQAEVALTDGMNSPNQNFQDFPTTNWNFGVAGRVQYKLFGDWGAYDQFTSLGDKHDLMVVGGGLDWSQGGNTDQILQTVDVQYNQTSGLGLFGALYGRYTRNAPKGTGAATAVQNDTYDWGLIAQASYLIPNSKWEPFARYDFIHFDADSIPAGAGQDVNEIAVGVNYYVHGHDAKFTFDLSYLPDGSPVSDSGSDVLSSDDDELLLRGQFQLLL